MGSNILEVNDLKVHFPVKKGLFRRTAGFIKAVDGVTFNVKKGETLGLVGESGCGKTTVGRSIVRLNSPQEGQILFNGENILETKNTDLKQMRRNVQIIFQDPYSSLNPRHTIKSLIGEVLTVQMGYSKDEAAKETAELLKQVGLSPI